MIEITEIPPLTPGQESLVDFHSFINVLGVLRGELAILGLLTGHTEHRFEEGIGICDEMVSAVGHPVLARREAARVGERTDAILAELDTKLRVMRGPVDTAEIDVSLANIRSVLAILQVRACEILARAKSPTRWEVMDAEEVLADLHLFFSAVQKNAKGRYHVVFNAARQGHTDYYVDLRIETAPKCGLSMPPVFRDVMRDLIANARKYTPAGGRITAALYRDAQDLRFFVADTGRGIPRDELAGVFEFGKRASNVEDVRTHGGGFGLTKAFLVTKRFGGRFWIDSTVGAGTSIRIQIPCTVPTVDASTCATGEPALVSARSGC